KHKHAHRVPDVDEGDTGLIQQFRHWVIVGCQRGDPLTTFHESNALGRNFCVRLDVHSTARLNSPPSRESSFYWRLPTRPNTSPVFSETRTSLAARVWPGSTKSGAISQSGSSTKRRRCARGWGKVRVGVPRVSRPNAIKSRSSGRGSLS